MKQAPTVEFVRKENNLNIIKINDPDRVVCSVQLRDSTEILRAFRTFEGKRPMEYCMANDEYIAIEYFIEQKSYKLGIAMNGNALNLSPKFNAARDIAREEHRKKIRKRWAVKCK